MPLEHLFLTVSKIYCYSFCQFVMTIKAPGNIMIINTPRGHNIIHK